VTYYCLEGTNTTTIGTPHSPIPCPEGSFHYFYFFVLVFTVFEGVYCPSGMTTSVPSFDLTSPKLCVAGFYCPAMSSNPTTNQCPEYTTSHITPNKIIIFLQIRRTQHAYYQLDHQQGLEQNPDQIVFARKDISDMEVTASVVLQVVFVMNLSSVVVGYLLSISPHSKRNRFFVQCMYSLFCLCNTYLSTIQIFCSWSRSM
jgi:hypothetical protein